MKKMSICLWFNDEAQDAARFYTNIFPGGKILSTSYYSNEGSEKHGHKEGDVLSVQFEVMGQEFTALNGGPDFKFNESVSFIINCDTQSEIDFFWDKLTQGGQEIECGWLKDKYGVSWQVVPVVLDEMIRNKDQKKVDRVFKSFMQMKKLDMAEILKAYEG